MVLNRYPVSDCSFDGLVTDAYDSEGNLIINSWKLFKWEELDRESDEQDNSPNIHILTDGKRCLTPANQAL